MSIAYESAKTREPVLRVRNIRKVYEGTVALGGIDMDVYPGEIHALLGENGAGKSTLVKILAGIERSDGGSISVGGSELPEHHSPQDAAEVRIAFIHQQFGLVSDMSVAENIALVTGYPMRNGRIDWNAVQDTARRALERMGVAIDPDELVGHLPVSGQSVVSIARALAQDAQLLVLDEPTASLTIAEVDTLFTVLRRLRSEGVASIYISHRLDEVRQVCDVATVLRDGKKVSTVKVQDISDDELIEMIIGETPQELVASVSTSGATAIAFRNVSAERLQDVSFEISYGEVFGVVGLNGSGHHEIGQVLFGMMPLSSGSVTLNGDEYQPRDASDAINHGLAFVPSDRNAEGAALEMTLRENLYLNPTAKFFSYLSNRHEVRAATTVLEDFDVRPPRPEAVFSTLSGGNAQKVVLARWISAGSQVVILNDPTAAVDIGARREIHKRLRAAAAQGAVVVVISSDMEEIEQVCDRAVVIRGGRVSADLSHSDINVAALTRYSYESN